VRPLQRQLLSTDRQDAWKSAAYRRIRFDYDVIAQVLDDQRKVP